MIYSPLGQKVFKFGFCARRWLCVCSPVLGDGAGGCFFATLYISPLWSVLSRYNCVMDNNPNHHLKRLYCCLFTCYLIVWCIPCAWSGDRTSVVVTTVVVTPTQSCVRLPGRDAVARFLRWWQPIQSCIG